MRQITDGASHTCLLGEIRAGVTDVDRRGTWALGAAGASMMWGTGSADDHGPNNPSTGADDLAECAEIHQQINTQALANMYMGCNEAGMSIQATARSLHPAGVNICMCDGAVLFISDNINCSTTWHFTTTKLIPSEFGVWESLMSAGDGQTIPANAY
jgi:prepilin-type processing-associated H-X9-DG protein